MPGPKPLHIFLVAEQFRHSAILSVEVPRIAPYVQELREAVGLYLPTSYMACRAFSLELYFKCLIRLGKKSFGKEHDLTKLFHMIGRRRKSSIKRYWMANSLQVISDIESMYLQNNRPVPTKKINFDYCLKIGKDAFTIIRYIYEGVGPDVGWAGDAIVEATRQTILDMHPDWIRLRQLFPAPVITYRPHP